MYTLRQINKKGVQANTNLGDHYHVVHRGQEDFERSNYVQKNKELLEKCFAIVIYAKGDYQEVWPLYEDFSYYIMTDTGKTFDNLTFK